ncbi:30S ribosomal protein S19 [Candidatus Woesearchaeota archaeon]|nr:30S ribosomal protein S19 [Candidatus Woesearchaeota archaeon]MBW3017923.1 30S ribosomal protein S19 [Candidatus Woesearchaeota archaeon]
MAKEFTFRGKTVAELKQLSLNEFAELLPANLRRSIKRGLTHQQTNLLKKIKTGKKKLKTHAREMVVLPQMIDLKLQIHNGKAFEEIYILPEMLGHRLGELVQTRKKVQHSAPGIGATRGTSSISVK